MPLNILIYSPKFYPSIGGLENITLMLAKQFIAAGHDVEVICFEESNGISCGIKTNYFPSIARQISLFRWANIFYMPNISLKGLWLLAINPFKTWVVSHNGWYGNSGLGYKKGIKEKLKLSITKFSKNIYVSNAVAKYINSPGTVIYNCYDNTVFKQTLKPSKNVLFVGRLVSDKGVDVLLKACLLLWQKQYLFSLTIIGDGDMKNWIKDFCNKHQINSNVSLKGFTVGDMLAEEMQNHKILVVPSKVKEGFGIVALEGLACGCLVISSNVGGLVEATGKFGYFFPKNNFQILAHHIEDLINKPICYNDSELKFFLKARQPEHIALQYLRVFENK